MAVIKLNEVEKAKMREIVSDPVLWAKAFVRTNDPKTKKVVPWIARDYQAEMLRDTHTRLVFRCGRRCIAAKTKVFDAEKGYYRTAKELFDEGKEFKTVTYNLENYTQEIDTARIWENGNKKVKLISTHLGKTILLTENHPLLTAEGWKETGELKVDDDIILVNQINFFGHNTIEEKEIKLIAHIYNSSSKRNDTYGFVLIKDSQGYNTLKEVLKLYNAKLIQSKTDEYFFTVKSEEVNNLLKKYYGINYIAEEIMSSDKETLTTFLSELFKVHTIIKKNKIIESDKSFLSIIYQNKYPQVIVNLHQILEQFGICVFYQTDENFCEITVDRTYYVIKMLDTFKLKYLKEKIGKRDYDFYSNGAKTYKENGYVPKHIIELLDSWTKNKKKEVLKKLKLDVSYNKSLKSALVTLHHFGEHKYDEMLTSEDIIWGRVTSIKDYSEQMTYDIETKTHHNFVANGFVTHNTGKTETMIISALYKALTKPSFRVLFAAPYEHQINAFWMRLKEILSNSPLINNEVKRLINSPYMIEFKNGSAILGFTTGASSGSNAASMRGQRSDWIFLDELDKNILFN